MPLVTDNSYGYNYTAVCPILDENGKAIAEIQYILDMKQVRQHLNSILYMMFGISFGIIAVGIVFIFCLCGKRSQIHWENWRNLHRILHFPVNFIKKYFYQYW